MLTSICLIALSVALSKYLDYFWEFLFLFTDFALKIRKRTVYGNDLDEFVKHIKYASTWNNDKPSGWVFGYVKFTSIFIGYIVEQSESSSKYLLVISSSDTILPKNVQKDIYICKRSGSFWNLKYVKELYIFCKKQLYPNQEIVINKILDIYKEKKYCSCLLYGEPNTGKTRTAYYLADCLLNSSANIKSVYIVTSWNPTAPNDSFMGVKNAISPSATSPLIIVLDEIDIMISRIHNGEIKLPHAPMPVEFLTKSDWNKFFDNFDYEIEKHIIIVTTSNKPIEYFDELDPSYMRDGRILVKHKF